VSIFVCVIYFPLSGSLFLVVLVVVVEDLFLVVKGGVLGDTDTNSSNSVGKVHAQVLVSTDSPDQTGLPSILVVENLS